jgi:organic radical activating enzyme
MTDYFCTAPWTHTYVSPQGERRLCCASREEAQFQKQYIDVDSQQGDFNPLTLEEHWNSEYMKDIRKRMLNGEKLSQCQVCHDQRLNLHTYQKYFTETLFPNMRKVIEEYTEEDGYTHLPPVSYDYRISNLCNFKCRMCGDQLSSSWEAEHKKFNRLQDDPWTQPETRKKIANFQEEVLEEELQKAVDNKTIEEIYWVGGEPLMWDRHWSIMQDLVDSGHSKNVTIRYNTNLSRVSYKNYNLYEMLPHFKNVNLCASIDATESIGEYVRTGLKWKEWLQNFKDGIFLVDQFGDNAMVFDITLTTPGLFGLKDLFDTVTELNVKAYFKFTFAFDPSVVMSPMCLPKHITVPLCNELIDYMKPKVTYKTQVFIDSLQNLMDRQSFDEEWPDSYKQGLKNGKGHMQFLEGIRKCDTTFRDILNKPAKEWWDAI